MDERVARVAPVVAALLLVIPALAAGPAVADGSERRSAVLPAVGVEYDDVLLSVDLRADGDAVWRISYRVRLDDANTTEAFEDLRADVRENPENYTDDFRRRLSGTADSAENVTGREMAIRNVTVTAETRQLPQEYGVITYRFEWTNFAAVEGDRIRAGAAVEGLFLDESTTLLFTWPDTHRVERVTPRESADVGSDRVSWSGPLEFAGGEPALVLTSAPTETETTTSTAASGDDPPLVAVVLALLLAVGVVVSYAHRRPSAGSGGGSTGSGGAPAATDAEEPESGADERPAELLSNEEQVVRLLESEGGRMKQQAVVRELDWTEAKTSQVISGMREDGEVETFRIGRENVVTLPDEDA
jgi:hypothetical protein